MATGSHDVKLLLPSITASVAVGLPFPVNSSPLRDQSVVREISSGYRKHAMQMTGPDSTPPPQSPTPSPSLYRALWSIEGESWSGLQIKAITLWLWRRKSGGGRVLASQTGILPQLRLVCGHTFLIPPPPAHLHTLLLLLLSHSSLSSAAPRRWLIAFSTLICPPGWKGLPGRD